LGLLLPVAVFAADNSTPMPQQESQLASLADYPTAPPAAAPVTPQVAAAGHAAPGTTTLANEGLDTYRGGTYVSNQAETNGVLQNTAASNVMTGRNVITDGAFAQASGLPVVIQNSGANVLIQNSTIVNVQFK
jgi:hypothetical protein